MLGLRGVQITEHSRECVIKTLIKGCGQAIPHVAHATIRLRVMRS